MGLNRAVSAVARLVQRTRRKEDERKVGGKTTFTESSSNLSGEHLLQEGLELIIPTHVQARLKAALLSNGWFITQRVLFRFSSICFKVLQMIGFRFGMQRIFLNKKLFTTQTREFKTLCEKKKILISPNISPLRLCY